MKPTKGLQLLVVPLKDGEFYSIRSVDVNGNDLGAKADCYTVGEPLPPMAFVQAHLPSWFSKSASPDAYDDFRLSKSANDYEDLPIYTGYPPEKIRELTQFDRTLLGDHLAVEMAADCAAYFDTRPAAGNQLYSREALIDIFKTAYEFGFVAAVNGMEIESINKDIENQEG